MLNGYKKEEIERIIKKGFDLELISFELDIPIEELKQIEMELKLNSSKMQQLRERYNNVYFNKKQNDKTSNIKLEQTEEDKINKKILEIKTITENSEKKTKNETNKEIDKISELVLKLKSKPLTIEQIESLYKIIESEKIQQKLNYLMDKDTNLEIKKSKNVIEGKLLDFIDFAQNNTDDIEKLKNLNEKITIEIMRNNPIKASTIKNKIMNKIRSNQNKQICREEINDVPEYIDDIVSDIINGTFDKEKIDERISKEVEKLYLNRKNKAFYFSKDQEKERIFIQLKNAMSKNTEKYRIERPDVVINRLYELCGGQKENSIKVVVENLINSKRFEEARKTCDHFLIKEGKDANYKYIRMLKNKIRAEELGDMILKGLKSEEYQDDKCFDLIEEGLKLGNLNLREIKLGKNQDGSKIITLEDIWNGKEKKGNIR